MNYEKAYKEALERAKQSLTYSDYPGFMRVDVIFPELAESEDEKIRKEIYKYFRDLQLSSDREFSPLISIDEILAWLEKHGEQKPFWSEKDEKMWAQVINEIEAIKSNSSTIFEKNIAQDKIDWLKSLKDRIKGE